MEWMESTWNDMDSTWIPCGMWGEGKDLTEMLGGSLERKEKARRLITQTVNCLTAKMEIGGPMASLYLLGNPDYYTSHEFVPVYWKNYVREILKCWRSEEDLEEIVPEKLVVQKSEQGKYIGFSPVHDYIYPKIFENRTLYEWVQMATRIKASKSNKVESEDELDLFQYKSSEDLETTKPNAQKYKTTVEDESEEEDELNLYSDDEFIEETNVDNEYKTQIEEHDISDSNKYFFLREHPLYKTHQVQFDDKVGDIHMESTSRASCDSVQIWQNWEKTRPWLPEARKWKLWSQHFVY
jgi:hypothetical protein